MATDTGDSADEKMLHYGMFVAFNKHLPPQSFELKKFKTMCRTYLDATVDVCQDVMDVLSALESLNVFSVGKYITLEELLQPVGVPKAIELVRELNKNIAEVREKRDGTGEQAKNTLLYSRKDPTVAHLRTQDTPIKIVIVGIGAAAELYGNSDVRKMIIEEIERLPDCSHNSLKDGSLILEIGVSSLQGFLAIWLECLNWKLARRISAIFESVRPGVRVFLKLEMTDNAICSILIRQGADFTNDNSLMNSKGAAVIQMLRSIKGVIARGNFEAGLRQCIDQLIAHIDSGLQSARKENDLQAVLPGVPTAPMSPLSQAKDQLDELERQKFHHFSLILQLSDLLPQGSEEFDKFRSACQHCITEEVDCDDVLDVLDILEKQKIFGIGIYDQLKDILRDSSLTAHSLLVEHEQQFGEYQNQTKATSIDGIVDVFESKLEWDDPGSNPHSLESKPNPSGNDTALQKDPSILSTMAVPPSMEEPLCLVENTAGGLVLNEETVKVISKIQATLSVVAIVGPYRTGKSFLLNRLMGKNSGFSLGSTVQSTTKGIWIWGRPHPTRPDEYLILLDTEGLGDVEKGDQNNDNWIFALAVLLSSTFVYNSMGTINQEAIDKLQFVTKLTELIKVKNVEEDEEGEEDGSAEFSHYFPAFVWTVRDFTLELEIDGKAVTPNQYLDHVLALKKGISPKVKDYNLPRECIKSFFPGRECFVFNRPVDNTDLLHALENVQDEQLDPSFKKTAEDFCDYVFKKSFPKTVRGQRLKGSMLCSLLQAYLGTIASGKVPCLENAFSSMAQIENRKAVEAAIEEYREIYKWAKLPTETQDDLSQLHQNFNAKALDTFLGLSFADSDVGFQKQLQEKVKEEYHNVSAKNTEASEQKCRQVWKSCSTDLDKNVKSDIYTEPGGYKKYDSDLKKAIANYKGTSGKGIMDEDMLTTFIGQRDAERAAILAGDKALTAKDNEIAEERKKAEKMKLEAQAAKEKAIQAEQKARDEKNSHDLHVKQLELKQAAEIKQLRSEQKREEENKLREQKELLEKGFKREAQKKADEIKELREEIQNQAQQLNEWKYALKALVHAAANTTGPAVSYSTENQEPL